MTKTKRCPRCGLVKPASEWYKNRASRDGLQAYCKVCLRSYQRQRLADPASREQHNAQQRARKQRRVADPEYRERLNEQQRVWRQKKMADPEYRARVNRQQKAAHQQRMADPEYRARYNARHWGYQLKRKLDIVS